MESCFLSIGFKVLRVCAAEAFLAKGGSFLLDLDGFFFESILLLFQSVYLQYFQYPVAIS